MFQLLSKRLKSFNAVEIFKQCVKIINNLDRQNTSLVYEIFFLGYCLCLIVSKNHLWKEKWSKTLNVLIKVHVLSTCMFGNSGCKLRSYHQVGERDISTVCCSTGLHLVVTMGLTGPAWYWNLVPGLPRPRPTVYPDTHCHV